MTATNRLTAHYSFGGLRGRIQDGLDRIEQAGSGTGTDALAAVDEFHVGGRSATEHLGEQLGLSGGERIIDLGSGLGGPARFFANEFGADVTGIDLTPEYVDVATWLTQVTEQTSSVRFQAGSVTDLPAELTGFDAATMIHVGMNLPDKHALATAAAGALRSGGRFGIYDIMATSLPAAHELPVPWASEAESSHVATPDDYVAALEGAGFSIDLIEDRGPQAVAFFDRLQAAPPADGPPPLGLHLVLGPNTATKIGNMAAAIRAGAIAPTIIIATAP